MEKVKKQLENWKKYDLTPIIKTIINKDETIELLVFNEIISSYI